MTYTREQLMAMDGDTLINTFMALQHNFQEIETQSRAFSSVLINSGLFITAVKEVMESEFDTSDYVTRDDVEDMISNYDSDNELVKEYQIEDLVNDTDISSRIREILEDASITVRFA